MRSVASILVVDDDADIRDIMTEYLEDVGFSVLQADCGSSALDAMASAPKFDVVVTDIRMPDMSGIELAERIAEIDSAMKVILISGYFPPQQVQRQFLRKPFRMRDLEDAVRAALAG